MGAAMCRDHCSSGVKEKLHIDALEHSMENGHADVASPGTKEPEQPQESHWGDVHAAPTQELMEVDNLMYRSAGIELEETVYLFDGAGRETFVLDHMPLKEVCKMTCCPLCCAHVNYKSHKRKVEYHKECGFCSALGCCSSTFDISMDGVFVGKVHGSGMLENGVMPCLCPCFLCSGKAKILSILGKEGEKFTVQRSMHPCWVVRKFCAVSCFPLCYFCHMIDGCCKYRTGHEIRTVKQPIWRGSWKRGEPASDLAGYLVITHRFHPVCLCCARPETMRYFFLPEDGHAGLVDDDLVAIGALLELYRGLPVPCRGLGFGQGTFQIPHGLPCTDHGLDTEVKWESVPDILAESDPGSGVKAPSVLKKALASVTGSKSVGVDFEHLMYLEHGKTREELVHDHVRLPDICKMVICPLCCAESPFRSTERNMDIHRVCCSCSTMTAMGCPYSIKSTGSDGVSTEIGKIANPGCCGNGALFCLLPGLMCGGGIKILSISNHEGERFVLKKRLFPCWACLELFALYCVPCALCCQACSGANKYHKKLEIRTVKQPIYRGPWKRGQPDTEQVGDLIMSHRFVPDGPCCCLAHAVPMRYYFQPVADMKEAAQLTDDDLVSIGALLRLYRGLHVPCRHFGCGLPCFQVPLGIPCTDLGLNTHVEWESVDTLIKQSG